MPNTKTLSTEDTLILHGIECTPSMSAVILGCVRVGDVIDETTITKATLEALKAATETNAGTILRYHASYESDRPDMEALKGLSGEELMEKMLEPKPCPVDLDTRIQSYIHIQKHEVADRNDLVSIRRSSLTELLTAAREAYDKAVPIRLEDYMAHLEAEKNPATKDIATKLRESRDLIQALEIPLMLVEQDLRIANQSS